VALPSRTARAWWQAFPDVVGVLCVLRQRGIAMAVVTDNWGTAESVRAMHDQIGLDGYFEAFFGSEGLGRS
jgi:phosphoglycolate phosphatase-like HAD superfamily hydrolase